MVAVAGYGTAVACGSEVLLEAPATGGNGSSASAGGQAAANGGGGASTSAKGGGSQASGGAGGAWGSGVGGGAACTSTGVACNDASECCAGWLCQDDPPGPVKKGTCCLQAFSLPCLDDADCCDGAPCLAGFCFAEG
jgi:hypothetical protein